jgi:hypothetical protein
MKIVALGASILAAITLSMSQTASAQRGFGVTTFAASIFDITFGPPIYGYYHYGHYGYYPKYGYPLVYRPYGYNAYRPYGQGHGYPSYGYGYGHIPGGL